MRYLGIEPRRPRVAVFDFTGCEGCELQLANKEETLLPFLQAVEVVAFREISSQPEAEDYDIAFIDGSITHPEEVERLKAIRRRAGTLVALGSCACFGGVSRLKDDAGDLEAVSREVYGEPRETLPTRAVHEVVPVDLELPGCPVSKDEVERVVQHLVWGVEFAPPAHPVCLDCKQHYTICQFDQGNLCLGPVTRGGCGAPCPVGGLGCWGCRGPAADANLPELISIARKRGFSEEEVQERFSFFGGFRGLLGEDARSEGSPS